MSDAFKNRERGEELRFEMSQELQFKCEARRNRLLGEWLAHKFGLTTDDAEAYVKDVIGSDLKEPGIDDIVGKVMADIEERKAGISEDEVRTEMDRLFAVAAEQVKNGFKSDTL
ncbi:MAG: DUF1476 domain-containing protein [Alphaproteobacteria bacterium]|jgi:hypothetical protein|nr:DUF1476 domain-containing protein [Alphaproteobacteria bacterium]